MYAFLHQNHYSMDLLTDELRVNSKLGRMIQTFDKQYYPSYLPNEIPTRMMTKRLVKMIVKKVLFWMGFLRRKNDLVII